MDAPSSHLSDKEKEVLKPWLARREEAQTDRKPYEKQWQINQHFAAGIQWLKWSQRDHRVVEVKKDDKGRQLDTVDVLSQYRDTAIGKLAAGGDFRPELLAAWENSEAGEMYSEQMNDQVDYAWSEECKGDRRSMAVLRALAEVGTGAIRCRYDRTKGSLIAKQVPHLDGKPLLDEAEQRSYVAERQALGQSADLRPLREGQIVWEKLSAWNLLPPPGVEDPEDFPWELIVRPVHLDELKAIYGKKAEGVSEDSIEDMGMLTYTPPRIDGGTLTPATVRNLEKHALVYTGYLHPTSDFPEGQTVVFTNDGHLLSEQKKMPYQQEPWGPRSGITYFRWTILDGRFWGRAFIEPGIGPQKSRNKLESQIQETIDRGQPFWIEEENSIVKAPSGAIMERVTLRPGSQPPQRIGGVNPGEWMFRARENADENIEKTLGLHEGSLGENPANVGTYSQLVLLTEKDAQKFEPIAQDFRLGIADVVRDTVEAMQEWPADKKLLIAGEENQLRVVAFDRQAIPPAYICRPAKGGTLARTQGSQLQKVTDIWTAALAAGVVALDPPAWIAWYKQSIDAGQPLDLPAMAGRNEGVHKAALENLLMQQGVVPPVAPYDDVQVHIPEHRSLEMQMQMAAEMGDQNAIGTLQRIEQHLQEHQMVAAQNAAQTASVQAPAPPGQQQAA